MIAAAATSSRREAPWPEPNTGLVILTSLVIFAQVESIGLSKVVTQSRLDELVEQCLCCVREERIYGAFPDAHKQGNIYCGLRYGLRYGVRRNLLREIFHRGSTC